jgi:hypothetical protein
VNRIPDGKVHPDLLAYARQTFNEEEYVAELREVLANGGVPFEVVIREISAT